MISFLQQHNVFMDYQWLQAQFKLHPDKKKSDLANGLGLEAPAISKILAGTRHIKAQEYLFMRTFFGLPNDGERHIKRNKHTIQSYVGGSQKNTLQDSYSSQDNNWVIPSKHLPQQLGDNYESLRVFKIEDDWMSPELKKGSFVLLDMSQKEPSPPGTFLISDGIGEIVRRCSYVAQSTPSKLKITPANSDYDSDIVTFKDGIVLGRVVAKLEWV